MTTTDECPKCDSPEAMVLHADDCPVWLDIRRTIERRFVDLLDKHDGDLDAIVRELLTEALA